MSNIRTQIFEKSKQLKRLLMIDTSANDSDKPICGFVQKYTEEYIWFQQVNAFGQPNGCMLVSISDISVLTWGTPNDLALQYLVQNPIPNSDEIGDFFNKEIQAENWQYEVLTSIQSEKTIGIMLKVGYEEYLYGFLKEFDEELLVIQLISETGQDEGFLLQTLSDIQSIEINNLETRKRLHLYEWKTGNGKRAP